MESYHWPSETWGCLFQFFLYLFYVKSEANLKVLQKHDDGFTPANQFQKLDISIDANAERDAASDKILGIDGCLSSDLRSLPHSRWINFEIHWRKIIYFTASDGLVWKWSSVQLCNVPNNPSYYLPLLCAYLSAHVPLLLSFQIQSTPLPASFDAAAPVTIREESDLSNHAVLTLDQP